MSARILSVLLLCASAGCFAKEQVCLRSGFCLQADSHTQTQDNFQFRIASGVVEFPAVEIARIEALPTPPESPIAQRAQAKPDSRSLLQEAANAEYVDADFVRSVAKIESGYSQEAISKKGAIGLMQIMPATAKELGIDASLAQENARGGAKYLRSLLLRYNGNSALALAAYNAGPGAVQHFGGVPPFEETRRYIVKVTREYDRQRLESAKRKTAQLSARARDNR